MEQSMSFNERVLANQRWIDQQDLKARNDHRAKKGLPPSKRPIAHPMDIPKPIQAQ